MCRRTSRHTLRHRQITKLPGRTRIIRHASNARMRRRFTRHHAAAKEIAIGVVAAPRHTRIVDFAVLPRSTNIVCRETRNTRVRRDIAYRNRRRSRTIAVVATPRNARIVRFAVAPYTANIIRRQTCDAFVCRGITHRTKRRVHAIGIHHASRLTSPCPPPDKLAVFPPSPPFPAFPPPAVCPNPP